MVQNHSASHKQKRRKESQREKEFELQIRFRFKSEGAGYPGNMSLFTSCQPYKTPGIEYPPLFAIYTVEIDLRSAQPVRIFELRIIAPFHIEKDCPIPCRSYPGAADSSRLGARRRAR